MMFCVCCEKICWPHGRLEPLEGLSVTKLDVVVTVMEHLWSFNSIWSRGESWVWQILVLACLAVPSYYRVFPPSSPGPAPAPASHSSLLSSVAQPASLPHCSPCCSAPSLHSSTASLASLQTRNIFLSAASFLILIPLCSNVNRASVRLYQKISKYKNHFNESLEIQ